MVTCSHSSISQRWTGKYFETISLKSLGLRVQLGHRPGDRCYNPVPAFGDAFIVLDLHGIHEVGVNFCGCEHAVSTVNQLLRFRWFPATSTEPRTAATFRLLQTFHLLSGQSKISAFEFYTTLSRKSDNTGTGSPKARDAHLCSLRSYSWADIGTGLLCFLPSYDTAMALPQDAQARWPGQYT